ncbi:cadherin-like beta sandwich domain-containing protein [Eubacterium sp.]|uniref:cadherin-like beta sandwich domain-containing protein n=1 Tax=Eubacterium sp. TaxID=142586 RepID=UPI003FA5C73E
MTNLSLGSVTLSPAFNADTLNYSAATTNATNIITASATDSSATVVIKNGNTVVPNGGAATWVSGENTVTVTVTNGVVSKTYSITVTKS